MGSNVIKRGEIYWVNLNPVHGKEQAGKRPVLVVSSDAINSQPLVITVVVGTDAKNVLRDYPINVRANAKETGLPMDTVFLCFQIRSLDQGRFTNPVTGILNLAGVMPSTKMAQIDLALALALNLTHPNGFKGSSLKQ